MLNTALLLRMSQKSQHTRYEEIILGQTCCEEAPQFVPACARVSSKPIRHSSIWSIYGYARVSLLWEFSLNHNYLQSVLNFPQLGKHEFNLSDKGTCPYPRTQNFKILQVPVCYRTWVYLHRHLQIPKSVAIVEASLTTGGLGKSFLWPSKQHPADLCNVFDVKIVSIKSQMS